MYSKEHIEQFYELVRHIRGRQFSQILIGIWGQLHLEFLGLIYFKCF